MECNRDEAVRARDIAELKYAKQDFAGAKKFLLKAQQLFPTLEGLTQMIGVLEVHAVAQTKVGANEMDWYGILQVEPSADDNTIKKQYRKLALLLHPDKNKASGAEAAFKLLGEAWGILSDKGKRHFHDLRRKQTKVPHLQPVFHQQTHPHPAPAPPPAPAPAPPAQSQANGTFWTSCPACKMQYQYLRTYENYQLQCPKCMEVFVARDIHSTASGNGSFSWTPFPEASRQESNFAKPGGAPFNGTGANGFANGGLGPFASHFPNQTNNPAYYSSAAAAAAAQSKVAAAAAAAASSAVPAANNHAADVVQQTYQKVKRERVEAEKEVKRKEKEMRRKEKDEQRREKDMQRKSRDADRAREGLDRLVAKRREQQIREEAKRRMEVKLGRKLKRRKRSSDNREDEVLEDEDLKGVEEGAQDDVSVPGGHPRRRSGRAKTKVPTYKVDASDSDMEEFPRPKRMKSEGDSEDDESGTEKSEAENGRGQGMHRAHGENGAKGKSVAGNSGDEKRGGGLNGGEELNGERERKSLTTDSRETNEKIKGDQGGVRLRDSHISDYMQNVGNLEGAARGSKVSDSSREAHKVKAVKAVKADEAGPRGMKSEDMQDEKSPSKPSTRTLRMRVNSPQPPKGPLRSHAEAVEKKRAGAEGDQSPEQRFSSTGSHSSSAKEEEEEEESQKKIEKIEVLDPDFHDFDSVRTETDIHSGQIWAVYDDEDGMPRFYGRVTRVTLNPFKAHLCWLELTRPSNLIDWTKRTGLAVSCGEFRIGKPIIFEHINTFSHIVVAKAAKGVVRIYPKKEQVWAIYRDSDPERGLGPKKVLNARRENTYAYDMVEVLTDFSEEKGVKTVKLVKVRGFKTLFQRQDGQDAIRFFKVLELPNFSHSVPVERMGPDMLGSMVPHGALELDPASTPMDLLLGTSDHSR